MNLFQSGGHSSHPTTMPFGYVVVQYINPKSYYQDYLVYLLIQPQEGLKDEYFDPKQQTRLYVEKAGTVSIPCFYKRRDKNNSTSKNCHLRSLSYPINEYIFHLRYQRFIPALKRSRFLAKNSRKLLKSLEIFTFFSLSLNSKNRLISPPLQSI